MWEIILLTIITILVNIYLLYNYSKNSKEVQNKFVFTFYQVQNERLKDAMMKIGRPWIQVDTKTGSTIENNSTLFIISGYKDVNYLGTKLNNVYYSGGLMVGFYGETENITKVEVGINRYEPLELIIKHTYNKQVASIYARQK